jgi:hypothetical protein
MAYELVQSGRTQFAIDWDIVGRIVRSYHRACLQWDLAREVTMSESHWYNPLSWSLPEISHVEVDWDSVRIYADRYTDEDVRNLRAIATMDAARVGRRLDEMIDTTAVKKEAFVEWLGTVQTQNMRSVNKAVGDYESKIEIAKFIRDASADGLMVGASVMTGGGAIAAVGGASFFKGACKFQDTDSVGAAVMEGVGSFTFAYVKLGKSFSIKEDLMLAFVQAPYKAGTELVGGSTISEAVLKGGVKLAAPGVEGLFKLGPMRTLFDKVAVPIVITYGGKDVASTTLSKFAGKVATKGVETWAKGTLHPGKADGGEDARASRRGGQLVANATLSDKFLLYLAFVNMEKGIGRGW